MHFRLYTSADFPRLYAIEEICFQPPLRFPRRYMRQLVESQDSATWIAEQADQLAGFAIVEWSGDPANPQAYIQTLEVSPQHRRQGIALELLLRLESSARSAGATTIWLHVDAENTSAIALYRAHGYQQQGREEHYYARHRPAEIYAKSLTPIPNP
ncbi:MAG TPA: N-acetyltransferase [Terracidiphilus sp.]|jgi:ribosomal-protein-alanine N-acetyltransferase|nr:N-acetyltransferase [Terracidiphilus sp.]